MCLWCASRLGRGVVRRRSQRVRATTRALVLLQEVPDSVRTFLQGPRNHDFDERLLRGLHRLDLPHLAANYSSAVHNHGERTHRILCVHGTALHVLPLILADGFRNSGCGSVYPHAVCVSPRIVESKQYTDCFGHDTRSVGAHQRASRGESFVLILAELHCDMDGEPRLVGVQREVEWCNRVVGEPQACRIPEFLVPRYLLWF